MLTFLWVGKSPEEKNEERQNKKFGKLFVKKKTRLLNEAFLKLEKNSHYESLINMVEIFNILSLG